MEIFNEIKKMDNTIRQLIIDKFLNINVIEQLCDVYDNNIIRTVMLLKEKTEYLKKNNPLSYRKITFIKSIIRCSIRKNYIEALITEMYWEDNSDYSTDEVKLRIIIKIPNVPNFFLSAENKKIKNKITELFKYKTNEIKYKNLKYVIDNQLNSKELRKIKLQEIGNSNEN